MLLFEKKTPATLLHSQGDLLNKLQGSTDPMVDVSFYPHTCVVTKSEYFTYNWVGTKQGGSQQRRRQTGVSLHPSGSCRGSSQFVAQIKLCTTLSFFLLGLHPILQLTITFALKAVLWVWEMNLVWGAEVSIDSVWDLEKFKGPIVDKVRCPCFFSWLLRWSYSCRDENWWKAWNVFWGLNIKHGESVKDNRCIWIKILFSNICAWNHVLLNTKDEAPGLW